MKKVFITSGSDFFCLKLVFCCSGVAFDTLPSYWTGSRTDRDIIGQWRLGLVVQPLTLISCMVRFVASGLVSVLCVGQCDAGPIGENHMCQVI